MKFPVLFFAAVASAAVHERAAAAMSLPDAQTYVATLLGSFPTCLLNCITNTTITAVNPALGVMLCSDLNSPASEVALVSQAPACLTKACTGTAVGQGATALANLTAAIPTLTSACMTILSAAMSTANGTAAATGAASASGSASASASGSASAAASSSTTTGASTSGAQAVFSGVVAAASFAVAFLL
ncbi:hypothetical protein HDU98_008403 [Podochytrium sp. JEL0797]|nr:hypothetical protein HDU98_008403 [Podochytrium sp. JEL0797]